ncbi:MAG: hypothetical protein Q7T71_11565 [Herbiconiux sp.]|nr:hypothetical protein [Herbiconiux sp.]
MIERFLRRPSGPGEVVADLLRMLGAVGVVVAAVWFSPTDAGVLAFVLPGLLLPRFLGARWGFDIAYCVTLLAAGWSNVLDLYTRVPWWDIVVHVACTGVIAAMVHLLLVRTGVIVEPPGPRAARVAPVVLTLMIGLAVSALWEMVEWFGKAFISASIFVAYDDTIGDMAVGGLGALAAGFVVAFAGTASGASGVGWRAPSTGRSTAMALELENTTINHRGVDYTLRGGAPKWEIARDGEPLGHLVITSPAGEEGEPVYTTVHLDGREGDTYGSDWDQIVKAHLNVADPAIAAGGDNSPGASQ